MKWLVLALLLACGPAHASNYMGGNFNWAKVVGYGTTQWGDCRVCHASLVPVGLQGTEEERTGLSRVISSGMTDPMDKRFARTFRMMQYEYQRYARVAFLCLAGHITIRRFPAEKVWGAEELEWD